MPASNVGSRLSFDGPDTKPRRTETMGAMAPPDGNEGPRVIDEVNPSEAEVAIDTAIDLKARLESQSLGRTIKARSRPQRRTVQSRTDLTIG
jgi:hypothetical protein